ncbi:MAG TPA: hypothetical protein IAB38_02675 [Candidatus Onthousia excrementipullorum]|uniref:Uncharacterized protein n=1 Tax=Candidatus Onthousia excrementipullorum TaxID=2840884 RepID=A0A9D1DTU9_9FIRM|nr:hypothetical protein [Candidatus Onthousia excrementipullorum]
MIERIIKNNIKILNPHLVMGYLESKNIYPTEDEAIVICNFLKENYNILLKDNSILLNLRGSVRDEIYSGVSTIIMNLKNTYL